MSQHTPGPWSIDRNVPYGEEDLYIESRHDGDGHVVVCAVWGMEHGPHVDPISQANARLIAAAPDLLAACKAANRSIEDFFAEDPPKDWSDSLRDGADCLRRAIAKTTSESHWDFDPEYPVDDWQSEVSSDCTRLGYGDWVHQQREMKIDSWSSRENDDDENIS